MKNTGFRKEICSLRHETSELSVKMHENEMIYLQNEYIAMNNMLYK